jgi:hypothetical protein
MWKVRAKITHQAGKGVLVYFEKTQRLKSVNAQLQQKNYILEASRWKNAFAPPPMLCEAVDCLHLAIPSIGS